MSAENISSQFPLSISISINFPLVFIYILYIFMCVDWYFSAKRMFIIKMNEIKKHLCKRITELLNK